MSLRINLVAPDFTAETTHGTINFYDWIGDGWALLFSQPKDFTPVCETELGAVAGLQSDFAQRNTKVIGISVDGMDDHEGWSKDIESATGNAVGYPLIGDPKLEIVNLYDMLPDDAGDTSEGRTASDNATDPSAFTIGPDKTIKATLTYPMTTGWNFAEILRLLDSMQLTASQAVATPVNWVQAITSLSCRRYLTSGLPRSTPTDSKLGCPISASSNSLPRLPVSDSAAQCSAQPYVSFRLPIG